MSLVFHGDETALWTNIRTRLLEARKEKGMSLRQLAALIGIDYSLVFRVEQGTRRVSLSVLDTWCEALDLPRFDVRADLMLADLSATEVSDLFAYCLLQKDGLWALDKAAAAAGEPRFAKRAELLFADLTPDEVSAVVQRYVQSQMKEVA